MTYVVGLTGGIACGKSNLSSALKGDGAAVIDADEISRALTARGGDALPKIRETFGDSVFCGAELDRKKLGALAFSDARAREKLNKLLHPLVFARMREQLDALKAQGAAVVFLDVPLLYETGLETWCDEVWCAYLPQEEQLKRLAARDGRGEADARLRVASQMPALEKKNRADRVVDTSGSKEMSASAVLSMYHALLSALQKEKSL